MTDKFLFCVVLYALIHFGGAVAGESSCENLLTARVSIEGVNGEELAKLAGRAWMLPRGSALMTSSGALERRGVKNIIHAASGSMFYEGRIFDPTLESVAGAIRNSLILAKNAGHEKIAIPFVGGRIFLERIGVTPGQLAEKIIDAAMTSRDGVKVRFVAYESYDYNIFKGILDKKYSEVSADEASVVSGGITDYSLHGASAIVNAANMEVVFGKGLSGAIARETGMRREIDMEARDTIMSFYEHYSKAGELK